MPYTPDLTRLLTAGSLYPDDHCQWRIEPHELGDSVLPTGRLVACDPMVNPDAEPFTETLPPGRFRTRAWVATLYQEGEVRQRRVAALQLVVRDQPATRWCLAVLPGQDPATLADDEFFGYPVDAGTGTLADETALRALADWDYDRIESVFIDNLPDAPVPGAVTTVTTQSTGANIVSVASGWGDGFYPTFVGYTRTGEVTCFVTDFLVIASA